MATLPEVSILPIPNRPGCCTSRQNSGGGTPLDVRARQRRSGNLWAALPRLRLNDIDFDRLPKCWHPSRDDLYAKLPMAESARRRAARRGASGSERSPSPCLRGMAVMQLDRPLGAGAACKGGPVVPRAPGGRLRARGADKAFVRGPRITSITSSPQIRHSSRCDRKRDRNDRHS